MSTDTSAVGVREIDSGTLPTRYARGWHCLGVAEDYRDGRPHAVEAFGTGDPRPAARFARLAETVEVVSALWTGDPVNHDGEYHQLDAILEEEVEEDELFSWW